MKQIERIDFLRSSFSTLDFADLAEEVAEGLDISPELVNTILTRYMRVVLRNVQRGHRVKFGDLLIIYPQISCNMKDELNDDGTVKTVATADMLNVISAKGSIGATIAQSRPVVVRQQRVVKARHRHHRHHRRRRQNRRQRRHYAHANSRQHWRHRQQQRKRQLRRRR